MSAAWWVVGILFAAVFIVLLIAAITSPVNDCDLM